MRRLLTLMLGVGLVVTASAASAADQVVRVHDNFFEPRATTVSVGDRVIWDFIGGRSHSVTADDGSFDSHPNCGSGSSFGGCSNSASPDFDHTFSTPGTFAYYCRIHGAKGGSGMAGVVTVQGSQPAATTTTAPATTTTPPTTTPPTTASTSAPSTTAARQTTSTTAAPTTTAPTTTAPTTTTTSTVELTTAVEDTTTTSTEFAAAVPSGDDGSGVPLLLLVLGILALLAGGGYALYRFYPRPGASSGLGDPLE